MPIKASCGLQVKVVLHRSDLFLQSLVERSPMMHSEVAYRSLWPFRHLSAPPSVVNVDPRLNCETIRSHRTTLEWEPMKLDCGGAKLARKRAQSK